MNKLLSAVLTASAFFIMVACDKDINEIPFTAPDEPTQEMTTQSFGMKLIVDKQSINKEAKSWSPATWVLNYSTDPAYLVLTGTGASAGQNYKELCTVAQLQTPGAVLINMLPGTYNITYKTAHKWTTDAWVFTIPQNGNLFTEEDLQYSPKVGDVLDIAVVNNGISITGTPIVLEATCDDALIIVDIPSVGGVKLYPSIDCSGNAPQMLRNIPNMYHFAYLNTPSFLRFTAGTERIVDASGYQKGNAYHLISEFEAASTINIPDMNVIDVEVPR